LASWNIEFESNEDFDIKFATEVKSRHQVKAKLADSTLSDIKNVISYRMVSRDGSSVRVEGFDTEGVPEDQRWLHSLNLIRGLECSSKSELKANYPNSNFKFHKNLYNVKAYIYCNNNKFCQFHTLKGLIINLIMRILNINSLNNANSHIAEERLYCLLECLNDRISEGHENGGCPTLLFSEIYEIITESDNFSRELEDSRLIRRLRFRLIEETEKSLEYILENHHENSPDDPHQTNELCRGIVEQMAEISCLQEKDFLILMKNLHIHKKDWKFDLDDNGLRDVILKYLFQTRCTITRDKRVYNTFQNYNYILTTIVNTAATSPIRSAPLALQKDIIKSLQSDGSISRLYSSSDKLVNANIEDSIDIKDILISLSEDYRTKHSDTYSNSQEGRKSSIFDYEKLDLIRVENAIQIVQRDREGTRC
jgi:hypothetical protein